MMKIKFLTLLSLSLASTSSFAADQKPMRSHCATDGSGDYLSYFRGGHNSADVRDAKTFAETCMKESQKHEKIFLENTWAGQSPCEVSCGGKNTVRKAWAKELAQPEIYFQAGNTTLYSYFRCACVCKRQSPLGKKAKCPKRSPGRSSLDSQEFEFLE